ncbi:MAG: hypothetical protein Q7V31_03720 [Parvibaculum sp.]|uniref:hypothetical protein n=1 Tax=Parvibaculum sp. TaxID=2024848 RepID=UPI0027193643|nr:hypothetical protein [Parvibaculum sp.]MDO8838011.1 hypothetical protein [Parvibaculum sp.]
MAARRRMQARDEAEREVPFRATVGQPKGGFGQSLNLMLDWCAGAFGQVTLPVAASRWQSYPAPPARDRTVETGWRFYFRSREDRDRFMAEGVPAGLAAMAEDRPGN